MVADGTWDRYQLYRDIHDELKAVEEMEVQRAAGRVTRVWRGGAGVLLHRGGGQQGQR